MFDEVRCHYAPLGEQFYDKTCQTKAFGAAMDTFWLDPKGRLWLVDVSDAYEFAYIGPWGFGGRWRPTGDRGRVKPWRHNGVVNIYPSSWTGGHESIPICILRFKDGIIQSYEHTTATKYYYV